MLAKRIIPCLDVRGGVVVKGIQFKDHRKVGEILPLAKYYSDEGADELVFYDITASCDNRVVDKSWVREISKNINIPFCVAGGIKSVKDAAKVLEYGADKISINSPALSDPNLITSLAREFGQQCIVVGIDSYFDKESRKYHVKQFTGDITKTRQTKWQTKDWVKEVVSLGAGEIVLNTINRDGMGEGYDISQLSLIRESCRVPLIASGGAGSMKHFSDVFLNAEVDGALAASVFHDNIMKISTLKKFLAQRKVEVRP